MNLEYWTKEALNWVIDYGPKVLMAIVIWIIGSWLIKRVVRLFTKAMQKKGHEESLQKFLSNLILWALKVALFITILGTLGVETTTFAAVIAAAGLAIGLALQGSLGNFAGGVLILLFKPFKIGDVIEAQGELGVVKVIDIFTTKLNTPTNKLAIIPNGALSNGNIVNFTTEGKLRIDLTIGVSYDADIKQTKEVLMRVLREQEKVLKEPAPTVAVLELADSSVNFAVRPWVETANYWDVYFHTVEHVKLSLDAAGIEIPYPHQVEIQKKA